MSLPEQFHQWWTRFRCQRKSLAEVLRLVLKSTQRSVLETFFCPCYFNIAFCYSLSVYNTNSIFLPGTSVIFTDLTAWTGTCHAHSSNCISPVFLSNAHLQLYIKTIDNTKKRGYCMPHLFYLMRKQ